MFFCLIRTVSQIHIIISLLIRTNAQKATIIDKKHWDKAHA